MAHPPRATGAHRWVRASYGSVGEADWSGLGQSFLRTARSTSPSRALCGAVCWICATPPLRRLRTGTPVLEFHHRPVRYPDVTLATERRVEIPIGLEFLRAAPASSRMLEVGNVLHRYHAPPRDVVDRYEAAPGVIAEDVVTFSPGHRYDRILSISTLEHVGFDEPVARPGSFRAAFEHLRRDLLAPEGRMLVTVPLGYNPEVDLYVRTVPASDARVTVLRRTSAFNEWEELPTERLSPRDLDRPFPGASAIAILEVGDPESAQERRVP